jgi:DNA gyrase inhibitor GyrI
MLYDYYKDNNLAAGGYAVVACRVKDDRLEKRFTELTQMVLSDSRETARLIIKLGGQIF